MGALHDAAKAAFADGPSSSPTEPPKSDIRALFAMADALIAQGVLGRGNLKASVRVATTTAGTITTAFENGDTVDGVVLATNDRILIKDQGTTAQNRIAVVQASGTPTRATDADTVAELIGATVYVREGTVNAGTAWTCNSTAETLVTLDSDPVTFAQIPGVTALTILSTAITDSSAIGRSVLTAADQAALQAIVGGLADATNIAAVIHAASGKTTPVDADTLPLIDSEASNALKKITWANVKAGIWAALGALIAGGTGKDTPVDADTLAMSDSAASGATKKLTWANLKATLKTYNDTLYATVAGLAAEASTRASADTTEATTRASADTALTAAVTSLGSSINTHATALYAADAAEAATRAAADTALDLAFDRRFDGDPKRPGDSPLSFIEVLTAGDPTAIAPLTSADTASGVDGRHFLLTAARPLIAERELTAMESGREYRVRYAVRRTVNSPDPANDAVQIAIAWYDQNKIALAGGSAFTAIATLTTLATSSGLVGGERILGLASGGNVQTVAPAGAVYFRAYIYQYGSAPSTAAIVLDSQDVTDFTVASPDLSSVTSRITALETIDAGDRLDDLESAVGTPSMLRFDVLANAVAATVGGGVDLLEIMALANPGDGWHRFYKRAVSEPDRQEKFQSADGAWWESTAQALVLIMNSQSNGGDDPSYEPTDIPLNLWEWDFYAQNDASTVVGTEFERPDGSYANIAIAFGAKLARARPECDVYVVGFAKGGITIDCWQGTGSYDMQEAIDGNMPVALDLAGATKVIAHQWWQGDGQAALATWSTDYNEVEDWLRTHDWFPENTPTLMHAPSPFNTTAKPMMKKILATCGDRPATRSFVDSSFLPIAYWDAVGDYIHATGEGRHLLGEAAYNVFEGHGRQAVVPGITVDPENGNMAFGTTSDGIPSLPATGVSFQFRNDVDGASNLLNMQNAYTTAGSAVLLQMVTDHSAFQMSVASAATFTTFRSFWAGPTAYWIGATNAAGSIIFSTGGFNVTMTLDAARKVGIGAAFPDRQLHVEWSSAATNTVTYMQRLTSLSDGTPAAGIGVGLEFEVETASGNNEVGATIEAVTTDVTSTSEDFDLVFKAMAAGAAAAEVARFKSTGAFIHKPPASAPSLSTNGELTIEATSNTVLTFKYRGSDGTTRSGTIALS
jgi:hypothetical protein